MYEVKQAAIPKARGTSRVSATQAEIMAAIKGKLQPREEKGHKRQTQLVQRGRNDVPVGRPVGITTGLPIFMAICYALQQNEKADKAMKLTDQQIAEWLRLEFPGRGTDYWNHVQEMRKQYNNGRYTRNQRPIVKSHRYDSGGTEIDPVYARKR